MAETRCLLIRCDHPNCAAQLTLPEVPSLEAAAERAAHAGWQLLDLCPDHRTGPTGSSLSAGRTSPAGGTGADLVGRLAFILPQLGLAYDPAEARRIARTIVDAMGRPADDREEVT